METMKGPKGSRVLNPTLQISHMRYTAKGKACCPGSSPPSSAQWRRKDLAQPFCVSGVGKDIRGKTDRAWEMQPLDAGGPSRVQTSAEASGSWASPQKRQTGAGACRSRGRTGARPCLCYYLCSSCSCIPFGLYTPGTIQARSN